MWERLNLNRELKSKWGLGKTQTLQK
jgi:hypothetical protein